MTEKCGLCGGTLGMMQHTDNADGVTVCGGCICKAVRMLKRVESGEAVVIEKRFGGYPEINCMPGLGYTAGRTQEDGEYRQAVASSYEGVVSAWNGRAME